MKKKLILPFLTILLSYSAYGSGDIDCNDRQNMKLNACGHKQISMLQSIAGSDCQQSEDCQVENSLFYLINGKRYMVGAALTDSSEHEYEDDSYTVAIYITTNNGQGTSGHDVNTQPFSSIARVIEHEKALGGEEKKEVEKKEEAGKKVVDNNGVGGEEKKVDDNVEDEKKVSEAADLLDTFKVIANAPRFSAETPIKFKNGTDSFKICQRAMAAAGTNFKELARTSDLTSKRDKFYKMAKAFTKYYIKNGAGDDEIDLAVYKNMTDAQKPQLQQRAQTEKEGLNDAIVRAISSVRTCVLLVKVTKENFDDKDQRYKDTEYLKPEVVTSFDQRLKCRSNGLETIDYDECRNMIYAYNGSKVVIDGNEALQVFQGQEAANEANMKLMDMKPNEDVSTKALEVQKDGITKQKEMAEVRAGLQTAKLATMASFAALLPDDEKVINLCKENGHMQTIVGHVLRKLKKGITSASSQLNDFDTDSETQCLASYQNDDHGILANTGQKPTAVAIAAEAGIDMAKEMMAVDMLDRQEKMVDGVIGKVKGMDTIDLPEDAFQSPELVTFCQANPNAQECVGFGTGMTTHVNSGGLSFTGGLAANETLNPTTDSDDNATAITTGSTDRESTNSLPTSRAIASVDKGGGFEGSSPGKAKVSSSPVGSGGGGAGGGGAPGGGGLSGSGPSTGGKGVAPSSNGRKYKLGYSGGSRPLSFRGGSKRSKRSSSKGVGNPFAKMMKKKGKSTDVFNFRGLASKGIGSKDGDLFKRISNSYNTVNKKNRLIKYKIAE